MSNAHVWRAAQDRLRREMSRAQFDMWLGGTALTAAADGSHLLSVRTTVARDMLEQAWHDRIESALAEVTGRRRSLCIVVASSGENDGERVGGAAPDSLRATHSRTHVQGQAHSRALPASRARSPQANNAHGSGYTMTSLFDARDARDRGTDSVHGDGHTPDPAFDRHASPAWESAPARMLSTDRSRGSQAPHTATGLEGGRRSLQPGTPGTFGTGAGETRDPGRSPGSHVEEARALGGSAAMDDEDELLEEMPTMLQSSQPGGDADGEGAGEWNAPIPTPRFNTRYTFDTFIVGRPNQFAHAASLAVAEAPGHVYNPLFLYGGVGLGKTHLLHAIGHSALSQGLTVLYVTSETFTNEIINAIRYRTTEQFRAKYRSVDVLLVDDIQFIAGKDSTEDEFFHTFNSLYEANKQIVMCSDRPPKAIISLEERLRSRFEWGLAADIQPPDHEMRVAILRAKADLMGRHVPDEVMTFLAGREQSNIRELEGSFNRVLAISDLQGLPLNIETTKLALVSLTSDARPRHVSVGDVLAAVAEYYRVDPKDLCGKQRDKHIVVPRQVAMYLMRQETEASLLEIGQALGGRDHSTVLHGCEKITRELSENTSLRKEVMTIRQQLLG